MWVEEAVHYYSVLPSASLLQHLPQSSSGNPLESLLLGFKALTQANFGSSVFVLGIHTTEYSFVCLLIMINMYMVEKAIRISAVSLKFACIHMICLYIQEQ